MLLEEKRFYIFQCSSVAKIYLLELFCQYFPLGEFLTLHNMVYLKNVFNFSLYKNEVKVKNGCANQDSPIQGYFLSQILLRSYVFLNYITSFLSVKVTADFLQKCFAHLLPTPICVLATCRNGDLADLISSWITLKKSRSIY